MKTGGMRRALALASVFNLLAAIYFTVIAIVWLVQLRWYHQLTITTKVRHVITSTTSYFAFLILIAVALILVAIFVIGTSKFSTKIYISSFKNQDEATRDARSSQIVATGGGGGGQASIKQRNRFQLLGASATKATAGRRLVAARDARASMALSRERRQQLDSGDSAASAGNNFCSMLLHVLAAIGLLVIIVIWLLNTGELVRDSISTQLDYAFGRYQFSNRSNHYSVAIDAMQNINSCCGSLDYTDFPHQRVSGLSTGHYPGSCCGKNVFGVNARVLCTPEEIVRAKQTTGCVIVIANHYDLVSLLVVPVALASLFVCIMVIAMMSLLRGDPSQLAGAGWLEQPHPQAAAAGAAVATGHRFSATLDNKPLELSGQPAAAAAAAAATSSSIDSQQ